MVRDGLESTHKGGAYTDLFVNLFDELDFLLQCLSSVLGVDVRQRFAVQVLRTDTYQVVA